MSPYERFVAWWTDRSSIGLSPSDSLDARFPMTAVVREVVESYIADAYLAAWSAAREEAVSAAEESISKRIAYLKESSDEEKKEYGYIRAKKEKWIDGRPCRGFRDGWTLFGFARNEMCIVYQELPAAIRSRLDAASRDGGRE